MSLIKEKSQSVIWMNLFGVKRNFFLLSLFLICLNKRKLPFQVEEGPRWPFENRRRRRSLCGSLLSTKGPRTLVDLQRSPLDPVSVESSPHRRTFPGLLSRVPILLDYCRWKVCVFIHLTDLKVIDVQRLKFLRTLKALDRNFSLVFYVSQKRRKRKNGRVFGRDQSLQS